MLIIKNLCVSIPHGFFYRPKKILHDININVETNSIYALIGENGAGKTTTFRSIMNRVRHQSWTITYTKTKPSIGYAPDQKNYYTHLSAWDNIMLVGLFTPHTQKEKLIIQQRAEKLLQKLGLWSCKDMIVQHFSQWMKKKLVLALSLIHDPELLLRDEPMSSIDPVGRNTIQNMMQNLREQGKTILYTSHELNQTQKIADKYAILHQGKIIHEQAMQDVTGNLTDLFMQKIQEKNSLQKI